MADEDGLLRQGLELAGDVVGDLGDSEPGQRCRVGPRGGGGGTVAGPTEGACLVTVLLEVGDPGIPRLTVQPETVDEDDVHIGAFTPIMLMATLRGSRRCNDNINRVTTPPMARGAARLRSARTRSLAAPSADCRRIFGKRASGVPAAAWKLVEVTPGLKPRT